MQVNQRVEFSIKLRTTLPKGLHEYSEEEFQDLLDDLAFQIQPFDHADDVTISDWREV